LLAAALGRAQAEGQDRLLLGVNRMDRLRRREDKCARLKSPADATDDPRIDKKSLFGTPRSTSARIGRNHAKTGLE